MATSSSSSRQLPALGRAARPAAAPHAGREPQHQRRSRKLDSRQRRREQERTDEEPEGHDDNEDDDDDYNRGRTTEEDEESLLAREEAALIDARFHRAVDIIQSLPKAGPITTTYEEKLMLYSLYKQGG